MRAFLLVSGWVMAGAALALPAGFYDRPLFGGLSGPTCVAFAPDGRVFAGQKTGAIRIYKNGQLLITPFMNVPCSSNSERGVLGLALDPNFASNRYVYIYYTTNASSLNAPPTPKNRVSRFVANGDTVQAGSEEILIDLIPSDAGNHNAGCIRFGNDGKLWIATGDGGATPSQSQDLNSLAGKLLRINPDGSVPSDNPFFGQSGKRPEVWAYGFRNPFRFTFRGNTGIPYIGDVGAVTWEEINVGAIGGNFGWPNAEGMSGNPNYINPIFAYPHNGNSRSVTGGVFLDSPRYPASMAGRYLFADYVQDTLFYLDVTQNNTLVSSGEFGHADGPVDLVMGPGNSVFYVAIGLGQVRKLTYEPRPLSMSLPTPLIGGQTGGGTVVLDVPAPAQGLEVTMASDNPFVFVSPSISFPSGASSRSFGFTTNAVSEATTVTLTATASGKSYRSSLVLLPNRVKGIFLPPTVVGGSQARGYVSLEASAAPGTTVDLRSNSGAAIVNASVSVPLGDTSTGFWITGIDVVIPTSATITATMNGVSKSRTLSVVPSDLADLSVTPNPIVGGESGTGTVTLRYGAEPSGAQITLRDNTSLINTPSSVTVPSGEIEATFTFTTVNVTVDATRTMSASYRGVTRTVTVLLLK